MATPASSELAGRHARRPPGRTACRCADRGRGSRPRRPVAGVARGGGATPRRGRSRRWRCGPVVGRAAAASGTGCRRRSSRFPTRCGRTGRRRHRPGAGPGSGRRLAEQLGVGLGPVVEEGRPQAVDGGSPHAEVGVAPLVLVAGVAVPLVGDADAAGERDRLVDHDHLAVGPVVDLGGAQAAQGAEPAHLDAGALHVVDQGAVDASGRRDRRAARGPGRRPWPGHR